MKPGSHVALRHSASHENAYLFVSSRNGVLQHGIEFLVKLLSRTHSSEFDLDIFTHPESRQENQILRKIDNFYRASHIQNADLPTFSNHCSLKHQLTSLRNCHEESSHLWMSNSNRTTFGNLFLKYRNHTPARSEDISESDRNEFRPAILQLQQQELGDAFCRSHNIGWANSLVRGDHDEILNSVFNSFCSQVIGSEDIVFYSLKGM